MKILYYAPNPNLSLKAQTGYGTHMREMINAWRNLGHEVETLIAGDLPGEDHLTELPNKVGLRKSFLKKIIPKYLWETLKDRNLVNLDLALAVKLEKLVQRFKPDMIYERTSYLQRSGIEVASRNKVKHVSEINAPFPEERIYFSGKSAYLKKARKVETDILQKSDCIAVVSSALKEYLTRMAPSCAEKIHVIPNAVNEILRRIDQIEVQALKDRYNPEGLLVIGFVGSVFPYHGVDLLLKAFKATKQNARLLIVGDGASINELKKFVEKHGLDKKVIFTGSVPHREVFHYTEIMDICCMMNSNWYGSPVKIFEYGLMGKAVIAPDVAPVRDVMVHEEDGLLVRASLDNITESLKRLVADKELRVKLAKNWNKKVIEKYTWEKAAIKTLEVCM